MNAEDAKALAENPDTPLIELILAKIVDKALNSDRSIMPKEFAWNASPPTLPNDKGEYPIPMPGFTEVL